MIEDLPDFDIFGFFEQAHEFITQNRKNTNVLVHCIVGASRSPTVVLSYLMKKWGMTLEDALGHLIAVRSIINPNVGFIK
jgi:protein-tyrosine phosphatase